MQTFDNTRPLVAAMAVGCARAALDEIEDLLKRGRRRARLRPAGLLAARGRRGLPADGGRLGGRLPAHARGHLDGRQQQAELAAGLDGQGEGRRGGVDITLRCVELAGAYGYSEDSLLEKWARDSKILDIFEGTQQIQQLIVARRLLDKTSAELK